MAWAEDRKPYLLPEMPDEGVSASWRRSPILRLLVAGRLIWPLALLTAGLMTALGIALLLFTGQVESTTLIPLLMASLLWCACFLGVSIVRLRTQLLKPLATLERSVAQVCQGEPGATLPLADSGVLYPMVRDIDSISEELTDLYEDMDSRVARQTTRLAQKTASLKILYDVAASINQSSDLDALLLRFLRVLKEMVNARAATVRIVMPDSTMRLVGSIGLDDALVQKEALFPLQLCLCGTTLSPGDILCENNPRHCSRLNGRTMFGSDSIELITVPLEYKEDTLGLYNLFVDKPGVSGREDIMELLSTIGSHLGMAVAKQRSDEEARRGSIMQERTSIAHELHDSLAQTLASLRFQVRILDDMLSGVQHFGEARTEVGRIRNGLDEAHRELRELLNSFRAPIDERGLIPALEKITERFEQETGISTFLQCECRQAGLPASSELQVLRIVQEALANTRKHANAHTVRVLLRCRASGEHLLLVEDDGCGFDTPVADGNPGEHLGLSIMQERARRLGALLRIESEPGEGTRIELVLRGGSKAAGGEGGG